MDQFAKFCSSQRQFPNFMVSNLLSERRTYCGLWSIHRYVYQMFNNHWSHAHTVVCVCWKDDHKSLQERAKFDPQPIISHLFMLQLVLLIAEVDGQFTKIGSLVRKLHKLGFELENKSDHWSAANLARFHESRQIPWLGPKFCGPQRTVVSINHKQYNNYYKRMHLH